MSSPFVAEIRIFPFGFAPKGWAMCNGQLLPISQNTALFSLLGTFYGGDGKSTFALPDLMGSAPVQQGQGPGLSPRYLGEMGGAQTVTLLSAEMPMHTHALQAFAGRGANTNAPSPEVTLSSSQGNFVYDSAPPSQFVHMDPGMLPPSGDSGPHNNLQPCLTVNFCIALQGLYPTRP